MGIYIYGYVMPRGQDNEVIFTDMTYRTSFYDTYANAEGVSAISVPEIIERDHFNDNKSGHRMTPKTYIRCAKAYRDAFDAEYPDEGPMYIDDVTKWLCLLSTNDLEKIDVVLVQEAM